VLHWRFWLLRSEVVFGLVVAASDHICAHFRVVTFHNILFLLIHKALEVFVHLSALGIRGVCDVSSIYVIAELLLCLRPLVYGLIEDV